MSGGRRGSRGPATLRPSGCAGIAWGAVLLWRGQSLFGALEHRDPSRGEQLAITVLGVRHLGQGLLQLLAPTRFGRCYAAVDGIHAASMVVMAAAVDSRRRAALLSGAIAAMSGVMAGRAARSGRRS